MDDDKMSCGFGCKWFRGKRDRMTLSQCAQGNFMTESVSLKTIYKVPQRIRQANKDVFEPYEPQIVSIGPYHHLKKKEFEEFEKHKQLYRDSILSRNPTHPLEDCYTEIANLEDEARSYYSEDVGLDPKKFVEMMVLDGCFIVELFLRYDMLLLGKKKKSKDVPKPEKEQYEEEESKEDPIFGPIWMLPLIRYDMLLLENQIPFIVLEIIYKKACPGNGSLVKLALDFFKPIIPKTSYYLNVQYFHLLHLFHTYLCPKGSNKAKSTISNIGSPRIKMIPCAAELQLAGVKFKKKKDFSSILDVEFSGGVLEIPQWFIEDYTNTLFRNLVALEQFCYPRVKLYFTSYVRFMDCLVNTSKDVALLHRNGIIDHLLGSAEDVARLWNQLCYGIFVDFKENNYLFGIYEKVNTHYNTPWNMYWASLRSDYFTNPWASLSSAAAVILILLTMAQTFYTIFAYYRPGS